MEDNNNNNQYNTPDKNGQNSPTNRNSNINQFDQVQYQDNMLKTQILQAQQSQNLYQQQQQYTNEEEYLNHMKSDFRYFIINVFYQLIKHSLYLIIFAQTAQFVFKKYESEGCYYEGNIQNLIVEQTRVLFQSHNHYATGGSSNNKTQQQQQSSSNSSQNSDYSKYLTMVDHENGQSLIAMVFNANVGLIFLNLISFVYIYVQKNFVKLEFNIVYFLNLSFSLMIIGYSLYDSSNNQYVCQSVQMFHLAFLYISIKKEIEIAILVYKEISDVTLRQFNICSNCVFAFLMVQAPNQAHCSANAEILVFGIEATNIIALVLFTACNYGYKSCSISEESRRALKFVVILLVATFFMVYIMVLYNFNSDKIPFDDDSCMPIRYVLRNYQFIVPISMIGIIFIFHSLNKDYDEEFSIQGHENQLTLQDQQQQQQQFNSPQLQHQQSQQNEYGGNKQEYEMQNNNNNNNLLQSNVQQQQNQNSNLNLSYHTQQNNLYNQNSQQQLQNNNNFQQQNVQNFGTPQSQNYYQQQQQYGNNNNNNNNFQNNSSVFQLQDQQPVTLDQLVKSHHSPQNQRDQFYGQQQLYQQPQQFY